MVFERAAAAFRRVVREPGGATVPSPKAGHYDRLLYVLLTTLAAVQGETVENENDLLG
jgi:hypothetical protein